MANIDLPKIKSPEKGKAPLISADQDQIINPLSLPLQNSASDKKLRILAAAEEIISNKGFKEATISEIASQAGINDSIIYRYFKGKEDLLFSIIEERLKEGDVLLTRDLQGLIDPKSQLRKLMWGNLWYHNAFSAYSRILFFECLPSTQFYSSPAAQLLQKYVNRLTDILEHGVKQRVFRNDIPISLMRHMVLGTLDLTAIFFHELRESENPQFDFEDAAALIELIISPKRKSEKFNSDKPSGILNSAEKIIAKKGYEKTKMSEIARLAGVADGTIYEYFQNKDILLFSIPKKKLEQYNKELTEVFSPESIIGKLRRLIKYHFLIFLDDQDFLRIFVQNLYRNKGFYRSEAVEAFRRFYGFLEKVIEEGKSAGVFRPEINPRVFRNMFLGTFFHLTGRWVVDSKMSEIAMVREANELADLVMEAVLTEPYQSTQQNFLKVNKNAQIHS